MARLFRFLEKKRGRRRTGSNLVGSVGEAIFCGRCSCSACSRSPRWSPLQLLAPDPGSFALGVGRWLGILVMASFVMHRRRRPDLVRCCGSAPRPSAAGPWPAQAAELDLVHEAVPRPKHYPTLPPFDGLTNSPGIELAYRLPPAQSPGWRLLATTIFAWLVDRRGLHAHGVGDQRPPGRPARVVPDGLSRAVLWRSACWAIRFWLRQIWIDTGMGLTTLEISDCPLVPGHEYQVALAQHGHIHVKSLELWLVCEEEATYRQGTDIRTEVRRVYEAAALVAPRFSDRAERAFPGRRRPCRFRAAAMHSFHSPHNSVSWKLVVRGEVAHWPAFERGFPIVVYPGEATHAGRGGRATWPATRAAARTRPQRALGDGSRA